MSQTSSLNDLKLELASLIAKGEINVASSIEEIQSKLTNTVTEKQIDEAIYHLVCDNEYEQYLQLEVDEDFYDGF